MPQSRTVREIIDTFVTELTAALEAQTTAAIRGALGGEGPAPSRANGRRARRAGQVAVGPTVRRLPKGAKRPPEVLENLTKNLLATIKKKPASNIEELAEAMGVPTKDLALPIKKLLADKAISRKGQRRGTRYTAR